MSQHIKSGSIPKSLTLYSKPEIAIKFKWDDIAADESLATVYGLPTFVVSDENLETHKTAIQWANSRAYSEQNNNYSVTTVNNIPISCVRVIGLDIRSNGGRAWIVLLNNQYIVDMREDVLLDTILHVGINPGGKLNGSFIFARVGSSMKIIRVGSLLHNKMIQSTKFSASASISKLEVGGIYRNKTSQVVYLGEFYTRMISYGGDTNHHSRKISDSVKKYVTLNVDGYKNISTIKDINKAPYIHDLKFNNAMPKSYREKVGQLTDTDFILYLKDIIVDYIKTHVKKYDFVSFCAGYADLLNAEVSNTQYIHPLIQKILLK